MGCNWEFSGTRDIDISGEIIKGGEGRSQLHLEIETATNTVVIGDQCSGGGIQGDANWILHILCTD